MCRRWEAGAEKARRRGRMKDAGRVAAEVAEWGTAFRLTVLEEEEAQREGRSRRAGTVLPAAKVRAEEDHNRER
jgi:hypothetical protein